MKPINLIFPNQLFKNSELLSQDFRHFIIEESLFFNHYNFHKQKIFFHRCSMRNYYDFLKNKKFEVYYINSYDENSDIRKFIKNQDSKKVEVKTSSPLPKFKALTERINISVHYYNQQHILYLLTMKKNIKVA